VSHGKERNTFAGDQRKVPGLQLWERGGSATVHDQHLCIMAVSDGQESKPARDRRQELTRAGRQVTFTLTGQIPSGKNAVVVTRTGMRFPAKRFKLWREDALKQLAGQMNGHTKPLTESVTLECVYTPGDLRTRDVSGMLDAIFHIIVKAGLVVDDGQVWGVTWRRAAMDRKQPGLTFTISQL
jgi:Holliday junction resolvase RusA-like endonuclease